MKHCLDVSTVEYIAGQGCRNWEHKGSKEGLKTSGFFHSVKCYKRRKERDT